MSKGKFFKELLVYFILGICARIILLPLSLYPIALLVTAATRAAVKKMVDLAEV